MPRRLPKSITADVIADTLAMEVPPIPTADIHIHVYVAAKSEVAQAFLTIPHRSLADRVFDACWMWYFNRMVDTPTGPQYRKYAIGVSWYRM